MNLAIGAVSFAVSVGAVVAAPRFLAHRGDLDEQVRKLTRSFLGPPIPDTSFDRFGIRTRAEVAEVVGELVCEFKVPFAVGNAEIIAVTADLMSVEWYLAKEGGRPVLAARLDFNDGFQPWEFDFIGLADEQFGVSPRAARRIRGRVQEAIRRVDSHAKFRRIKHHVW